MKKNPAENMLAILHYQDYDAVPVLDFGYWDELLIEWRDAHLLTSEECELLEGPNPQYAKVSTMVSRRQGFDEVYASIGFNAHLFPTFEPRVIKTFPDGRIHRQNRDGVIVLDIPGAVGIPTEIEHTLVDRASWEKEYLPRMQWSEKRLGENLAERIAAVNNRPDRITCFHVGSGIGTIRNILGIVGLSYMQMDDPELLHEIVRTFADISYRGVKIMLEAGLRPQMAHYWEDISFNHGPLVTPTFFREEIVPFYQRTTSLLREYGCDLVSVDSDGKLDELVPLFLEGGVNIMFPIEIGTWKTDFSNWRKLHGRELRGIGGMNKHVLSYDKAAVDAELERLRPWIELGGYIPCPDHRLPPGTKWELVQYYTDRFRTLYS